MDGLLLWKSNLDKHFSGIEDCMICFSVIHGSLYSLPKMTCRTCKKRFHSACLVRLCFCGACGFVCVNVRTHMYILCVYRVSREILFPCSTSGSVQVTRAVVLSAETYSRVYTVYLRVFYLKLTITITIQCVCTSIYIICRST